MAEACSETITTLTTHLDRANHRVDMLEAQLADVKSAFSIVTDSATALQAKLDRQDGWGTLRRLKWALRHR
jgi:hypothetical protein